MCICSTEKKDALFLKYNPLTQDGRHGELSLTANRKRRKIEARQQNGKIIFDPSITSKNNLTKCFCIFTNSDTNLRQPAQHGINPGTNLRHQTIKTYTDEACLNNRKLNAQCRSGIWIAPGDHRNQAIRVSGNEQSNQIGELVAVIKATQDLLIFAPLEIHSDLKYVIKGLTVHLERWEDIGWIAIQNATLFKKAAFVLRR